MYNDLCAGIHGNYHPATSQPLQAGHGQGLVGVIVGSVGLGSAIDGFVYCELLRLRLACIRQLNWSQSKDRAWVDESCFLPLLLHKLIIQWWQFDGRNSGPYSDVAFLVQLSCTPIPRQKTAYPRGSRTARSQIESPPKQNSAKNKLSQTTMLLLNLSLAALSLLATTAQAIWNPIISGWNPDPSILRVGSDYYIATSSFEYWPSVPIYHSKMRFYLFLPDFKSNKIARQRLVQLDSGDARRKPSWPSTALWHAYGSGLETHYIESILVVATNMFCRCLGSKSVVLRWQILAGKYDQMDLRSSCKSLASDLLHVVYRSYSLVRSGVGGTVGNWSRTVSWPYN